ncbi:MAG: ABC transporter permease [Propionibacteriaceae bacterium]|jgi:putative ABC transport system permease protein|nr:ABC transporter permease [Propionibacteriaceae bacterium]
MSDIPDSGLDTVIAAFGDDPTTTTEEVGAGTQPDRGGRSNRHRKADRNGKLGQSSRRAHRDSSHRAGEGAPSARRGRRQRTHLTLLDTLATATLGPRGRPLRAGLSALGIAIGIASLVAMLGIPASYQAEAEAKFNAWGANMVVASPATDRRTSEVSVLPESAPAMVDRIWSVNSALTVRAVPDASVYRSDKIPQAESKGLTAVVGEGDPLSTLTTTMASGRWFDNASSTLPTVVLGSNAAATLRAGLGQRLWIGQSWWAVIGILDQMPGFAGQYDSAAFLAPKAAANRWPGLPISQILVNAHPGEVDSVKSVLAETINPAKPAGVDVMKPTQYGYAQDYFFELFANLALGLGGIALLVGGIGIANTMVVSVLERRGEIGLRRALGARTGQVGLQFVVEAAIIGLLGGVLGVAFGAYAVFCFTAYSGIHFAIPAWVFAAGPGIAIVVGMLAGLYPSLKAARQSPTVTLRAT